MVTIDGDVIRLSLRNEADGPILPVDVIVGRNLTFRIASDLKELKLGYRHGVFSDSNVLIKTPHVLLLHTAMENAGLEARILHFEEGEENKRLSSIDKIGVDMDAAGFGRDSVLVAVGGGVSTDMGGYIAATYCGGIPLILVPTSTAAQADAAIGGKTGVNSETAKNRWRRIYQPKRIYIDVETVLTLEDRPYREGFAETIKHGIIQDAEFFRYLQKNVNLILKRDLDVLTYIARKNVMIKGNVVEQDPTEKGLRQILNYGHTVGHALETLSKYVQFMHGEAVSIGMMVAGRIAIGMGYFSKEALLEQEDLLQKFGLPTVIPAEIKNEDIMKAVLLDKKARGGRVRYTLPYVLGEMCHFDKKYYTTEVDDAIVINALNQTRA